MGEAALPPSIRSRDIPETSTSNVEQRYCLRVRIVLLLRNIMAVVSMQ
jgi:hypothetical protein